MNTLIGLLLSLAAPQDLDAVLKRADALLEEAKAAYENARASSSSAAFIDAGFKLEDARIKYLVLQEIGDDAKRKLAADRLRAVNQLNKLINDGKVAVSRPPAEAPPPPAPGAPAPPLAAPPPPPSAAPAARVPVPEPARLRDTEKQVRDLFKDRFAKKAPADRAALSRALLDEAQRSGEDAAGRWVLLRESLDVAASAGDLAVALEAADATAAYFDIDGLALRASAVSSVTKIAKTPADILRLAEASLLLADDFLALDQFDAAEKAAAAALQNAKRANHAPLAARATAKARDVADAKSRFAALKDVLEALAKNSEDGPANQEMGLYLCLIKGSWDLGLRFLGKASDVPLKALAKKDLGAPADAAEQAALGDAWWDLSEKEKLPGRKEKLRERAQSWYDTALQGATGLLRVRVEKRLVDLAGGQEPSTQGLVGRWLFSEGRGTNAADSSGKGNHGTLRGAVRWTSGYTGQGLAFDGGHVECGVEGFPAFNAPLTLAWSQFVSALPSERQCPIVLDNFGGRGTLAPGLKDGKLGLWKWEEVWLVTTAPPAAGEWHAIAYVSDGRANRLYVDGILKAQGTTPGDGSAPQRLEFGRWGGGGPFPASLHFRGSLDDIRLYTRALSEAEVKMLVRSRK